MQHERRSADHQKAAEGVTLTGAGESLAVGILPEGAAATYRKEMGLRFLNLWDAWASRRMYLCTRQEVLTFPQRRLVDPLLARSLV